MTHAELINRAKQIRDEYFNGAKTCDLCRKYNLTVNYLNQILENYKYPDPQYKKPFNKDQVKKLVKQLNAGGVSLYKTINIVFILYGKKLSINTIRKWIVS